MKIKQTTLSFTFGPAFAQWDGEWEEAMAKFIAAEGYTDVNITKSEGRADSYEIMDERNGLAALCDNSRCQFNFTNGTQYTEFAKQSIDFLLRLNKYWDKPICIPGLSLEIEGVEKDVFYKNELIPPKMLKSSELTYQATYDISTEDAPICKVTIYYFNNFGIKTCAISMGSSLTKETTRVNAMELKPYDEEPNEYRTFIGTAIGFLKSEFDLLG